MLTLDTYSHVLPDMQEGAAQRIEKLLFVKHNLTTHSLNHGLPIKVRPFLVRPEFVAHAMNPIVRVLV